MQVASHTWMDFKEIEWMKKVLEKKCKHESDGSRFHKVWSDAEQILST